MYNDFAVFLTSSVLLPILPDKIKNQPAVEQLVSTINNYCSDDKSFVFAHYVVCKKMCSDERSVESIRNILALVQDTEESNEKLKTSVAEIKECAKHISSVCESVIATEDEKIEEAIEKFCLFVEILTKQFLPPVVAVKKTH